MRVKILNNKGKSPMLALTWLPFNAIIDYSVTRNKGMLLNLAHTHYNITSISVILLKETKIDNNANRVVI